MKQDFCYGRTLCLASEGRNKPSINLTRTLVVFDSTRAIFIVPISTCVMNKKPWQQATGLLTMKKRGKKKGAFN